ncbi:MAG: trypsin-like peptidase domain-containing protein [Verrucomicrobia bacterium]|nr:trypsin-like peptidase domain-containing protein [Verrucomicrobiota bacterium]
MKRIILVSAAMVAASICLAARGAAQQPDELRRNAVVRAVEKAGPAVVNIGAERIIVVRRDPFWELFGDQTPYERYGKAYSLGSGVIIDPDGYIVTNEHVIRRASGIHVTVPNKDTAYEARLIASHPEHDIALIKIDVEEPLHYLEFADSDDLLIGETAIAIGNSYGLENTVTSGVVSATRRSITARGQVIFTDFIQTDAAINPGNSGGALVDIYGRLIGINSAMRYGAENIGFAIPINKVKQSLEMLLDPRQLKQLWVGVVLDPDDREHCTIIAVDPKSPADLAGLKPGDVLTSIDGDPIRGSYDYGLDMVKKSAGDEVRIGLERNGMPQTLTLKLTAAPKPSGKDLALKRFGLQVRDFTKDDAEGRHLDLKGGVLVTGVEKDSPAANKRLREGDIIVRVGVTFGIFSIPDLEHLGMLLEQLEPGDEALFAVVRDDYLLINYLTAR